MLQLGTSLCRCKPCHSLFLADVRRLGAWDVYMLFCDRVNIRMRLFRKVLVTLREMYTFNLEKALFSFVNSAVIGQLLCGRIIVPNEGWISEIFLKNL